MNQKAHRESGVNADVFWPEKRLKFAVSLRKSRVDGALDERPYLGLENIESWTGRRLSRSTGPDSDEAASGESLCNSFEPGDVLFGKLRPYLAKATVADFAGRCTTEFLVMQPADLTAKFLFYICVSRGFVTEVDTSTFGSRMPRADWANIGNLKIPIPTLEQQIALTDYLDAEISQVDSLVAAKERWLELLAEKRQALITHAVTRGINPKAPLRDSGIPWLGQMPKHWEIVRLKFLVTGFEQGGTPESFSYPAAAEEWGIVKTGCCNGGVFDPNQNKALPLGFDSLNALEIMPGDVLMSRASGSEDLIGSIARVPGNCRHRLVLSDKTYRLLVDQRQINSDFFVAILGSTVGRLQIQQVISGAPGLAKNIAIGDIKEFRLTLPPLAEQNAIVAHIAKETAKLDALRAAAENSIALLKERRGALISAAVTGKLRVSAKSGVAEGSAKMV